MPQTTGDYQSFLDNVLQMTKQTPADGTTFDSIHKQLLNNDTFLSAMLQGWIQKSVNSGVADFVSGVLDGAHSSIATGALGVNSTAANTVYVGKVDALVNGIKLHVAGVNSDGSTSITLDAPPASNVTPSLPGSARDDLVFLEAWRDATSGAWKSRFRVVDGVDFNTYAEGFPIAYVDGYTKNTNVVPQGGNAAPIAPSGNTVSYINNFSSANDSTSITDKNLSGADSGLYVAGDGSSTAKTTLSTLDGYVYAIPLFRVRRRNSAAFDPDNNPLGARLYQTISVNVPAGCSYQKTATLTTADTSMLSVGMTLGFGSIASNWYITAINSSTTFTAIDFYAGDNGTNPATNGVNYYIVSDRPDGLYSNIIDASDIVDLRHQVGVFDKKALLELGTQKLQRGQLATNQQARYARDYIGLQPLTDDVNTFLLANFDGASINGTANGTAATGTMNTGTASFVNGVQGMALAPSTSQYASYPVSIASGTSTYSIELVFKPNWNWNSDSANRGLLSLGGTGGSNSISSLFKNSDGSLRLYMLNNNTVYTELVATVPANLKAQLQAGAWHKVSLTVNNGTPVLAIDGQPLSISWLTGNSCSLTYAVANIFVGYDGIYGNFANSAIDFVRVSNIVRSEAQLPSTFSALNGDRILDGPNGDFSFWSDDVGGTTGTGGRTNPYGLSRVPNTDSNNNGKASRVSYNGSEIRHYLYNSQGLTAGWGVENAVGSYPTGAGDRSGEEIDVHSNETADGTITTFTFNKPPNAQGWFLLFNNSYADSFTVGGSYTTPSSFSIDVNGKVTATFSTAPASGSVVVSKYTTGSRHAHFVPSTKGFTIHDWTDDQKTGDGTTTAFTTTKKNVTSVNHVRVNGVIQNGGYTVTNTNQSGSGATITFTTAPANGATIDIVYESILTPALGDYIRIHYQHTPYQGLLGTAFAGSGTYRFMYVDEDGGFVTTLGTGSNSTPSVPAWVKDYPVMSAQLPISGSDYQLKHDVISLSNSTVSGASQQFLDNEQLYELNNSSAGNIYSPATTITPTTPTTRGYSVVGLNDGTAGRTVAVALRDIATSIPHVVGVPAIVQDTTSGELLLAVVTATRTDAKNGTDSGLAMDVFKLPGRPLIKSYGGVAA